MKYRREVELNVKRIKNCLERAKTATNHWDSVGNMYYACYHSMVAAIWAKQKFNESEFGTAHVKVLDTYIRLYSRTKGNNISKEKKVEKAVKRWKNLRVDADYYIFTADFEDKNLASTEEETLKMEEFATSHITHLENLLKPTQTST